MAMSAYVSPDRIKEFMDLNNISSFEELVCQIEKENSPTSLRGMVVCRKHMLEALRNGNACMEISEYIIRHGQESGNVVAA